jgi:hypothetical protein
MWTYPGVGLGQALGRTNPDINIWRYAIQSMGAVEVASHSRSATVSWRAADITRKAILGAERLLLALSPLRIHFRSDISIWVETLDGLARGLAERLKLGCLPETTEPPRPAFVGQALPLNGIAAPRQQHIATDEDRFAALFDWWRGKGGRCRQAELLEFLYRLDVIDRAGAVQTNADNDLVFTFSGIGLDVYKRYDESWAAQTAGRSFLDQPDPVYAAWCARSYRGAIKSQVPRFEFVDAIVRLPELSPQHTRYNRLLLPWRLPDGRAMVSLLSFKVPPPRTITSSARARSAESGRDTA